MNLPVKVKRLQPEAKLPSYAHSGDVGLDLFSLVEETIPPGGHAIFNLGFALEFSEGYAAMVKDKGSISKAGLHTMGGVFDAGYRGEYNVHLVNLSDQPYTVEKGDKVAQLVILSAAFAQFEEVPELSDSSRGEGRFGSTGRK